MFNEVAQRQVTLRTSGGTVRMSLLEATLMKAFETASAGSAHAQRNVLNHAMAIETKKQEQIAYDVAEWTEYRNITSEAIAISQQAGLPEPEFGIHPEDIRIDPQNGVSFTGRCGSEGRNLPRGSRPAVLTRSAHEGLACRTKAREAHIWALKRSLSALTCC